MSSFDTIAMILGPALVGVGLTSVMLLLRSSSVFEGSRQVDVGKLLVIPASLLTALLGFVLGASIGGTPATGFPIAVLSVGAPRSLRRRRLSEARRRRREAWPDAVQGLIASVLSGRSLHLAMLDLADDGPEPLRDFWTRYRRLSATLDQTTALEVVRSEYADPFVDRLVEVLIAASSSGPALAIEILGDVATAASEDLQFEMHLASANLEQKINSRVVAVVPSAALLLLVWSNEPAREFYSRPIGLAVAIVGSLVTGVGILVVDRLGRLVPEPRVFTRLEGATASVGERVGV